MWRLSRRRASGKGSCSYHASEGYGAVVCSLGGGSFVNKRVGVPTSNNGARKRSGKHNEVNILVLGDWQRLAQEMPPQTPVIFRYDGKKPMETEEYCDGLRAYPAQMWEGHSGWQPCILVELGECF